MLVAIAAQIKPIGRDDQHTSVQHAGVNMSEGPSLFLGERPIDTDLGFGPLVSSRRNYRLLNHDGTFNVRISHGSLWQQLVSYHGLLTMSWPRFLGLFSILYLALNLTFAGLYTYAGRHALEGTLEASTFWRAFFFSVHTFATVGYGNLFPATFAANVLVTFESLVGLMTFTLTTGLVFARFSRPVADIAFSRKALIIPYQQGAAFAFRIANRRRNQLVHLDVVLIHSRFENTETGRHRKYYPLTLERKHVAFFPLNLTVVHPITQDSPLRRWTHDMLMAAEAEFNILITAVDETFAQTVHSRASYNAAELVFGRRFKLMYHEENGEYVLDLDKIDDAETVPLPETSAQVQ